MKSRSMTKKVSVLFSAIAASSFLGLPALAQVNNNTNSNMRGDCVPATQADRLGPAADANAPGVREFPNQTEPRAGVNEQGMNNQANSGGGTADRSVTQNAPTSTDNSSSVGSTSQAQNNDQTAMTSPGVGAAQPNNVLASGGATSGGDSRQITQEATNPSGRVQSSGMQSSDSQRSDRTLRNQLAMTSPNVKAARYGDVLASGGTTNGGESNRIFQAANDPSTPRSDSYTSSAQSNQQGSYQSSQSTTGSSTQANRGATSGGESQQNVESSVTGTTSSQSSNRMSNQIASSQCPPGMVPSSQQDQGGSQQSAPNQQNPAQPAEQRGSRGGQ